MHLLRLVKIWFASDTQTELLSFGKLRTALAYISTRLFVAGYPVSRWT